MTESKEWVKIAYLNQQIFACAAMSGSDMAPAFLHQERKMKPPPGLF